MRRLVTAQSIALMLCAAPMSAQNSPESTRPKKVDPAVLDALSLDLGVPSSPAFELLPDRPSEVTHVTTPKDLQTNIRSFFTGTELRTGAALDIRPLSGLASSLKEYWKDRGKQVAWRSVLSLGTSARASSSSDVILALGLRLPVIDKGDPRADSAYIHRLESAYQSALEGEGQPDLPDDDSDSASQARSDSVFQARADRASAAIQAVRDSFRLSKWNALRLDLGVGGSLVANGGQLQRDKVSSDRAGAWVALAAPVWSIAELTVSGKGLWARTDSSTQETQRYLVGSRLRSFPVAGVALSVEVARAWSRYDLSNLNESWNHFAVGGDIKLPMNAGWLSLVYGGDTRRREDPDAMFSIEYAILKDRRMKP